MEEEDDDDGMDFFVIVEDMPTFQGGDLNDFHAYIKGSIRYPRIAEENSISGTVHINFIIDEKGNLIDIVIARGVDSSLDNEVIRALKAAPKWAPGRQRGKPVKVKMSLPVNFTLL